MEKNMEYIYQIYLDGSFSQAAKESIYFPASSQRDRSPDRAQPARHSV